MMHLQPTRRGFTLIELLVVITIIGILASMMLMALVGTQETARAAKTRGLIKKLDAIVMPRYAEYMNRRVPVTRRTPTDLPPTGESMSVFGARRLMMLRELMRLEMPDRFSDITDNPITHIRGGQPSDPLLPRPAVSRAYLRRLNAATNRTDTHQGAESLYMFVMLGAEDSDAITHFSDNDIKDVDGDGLPEFVDGWGNPISFIRWPAGFASPMQSLDASKDYDQFDARHVQGTPTNPTERAYAMFPLIYSAGPDGIQDLAANPVGTDIYTPTSGVKSGQPIDSDTDGEFNHADNIHNHDSQLR